MPLQLTTPLSVGAIDVNSPYQQVKIVEVKLCLTAGYIDLTTQAGNTVNGRWTNGMGIEGATVKRFRVEGSDYNTMVGAKSLGADDVYYDRVASLLYQCLIDKGHFSGSIV